MAAIRVLICDDAPAVRTVLGVVFAVHPGIELVAEAGDGQEAVDQARRHQPDVVLLDLAMPVMDGLQALPEIRAAAPEARVIVYSGFPQAGMAERVRLLGAVAYLEKGVEPAEITTLIEATAAGAR